MIYIDQPRQGEKNAEASVRKGEVKGEGVLSWRPWEGWDGFMLSLVAATPR